MLKLKNLTLRSGVIQSPMAGCTDLAYRLLAREHGMEFCFLEMVSAESLVRGNEGAHELMKTVPEDKPLGAQIVGCRPEAMGEAAAMIEARGYDLLDINFGCPVPKVAGNGAGSALLAEPDKARDIFKSVVKNVKKIPVTVKMRLGVTDGSGKEAERIARIAEDCGLDAVAVHGRTRAQGYSGTADWQAIGRIKKAVGIPVIGNGDVCSGEDAKRLREVSGCDGVMVGRGGLGNPWIFKDLERALNGGAESGGGSDVEAKRRALLRHLELEAAHRDDRTAALLMRRIGCWYFKSIPGANDFRSRITRCETVAEARRIIEEFDPSKHGPPAWDAAEDPAAD
jgi:nifR3 family TIM-barrel protein